LILIKSSPLGGCNIVFKRNKVVDERETKRSVRWSARFN
jgi:hypothetical protein